MKMHFILVVEGEDTLKTKLEDAIKNNPNLHQEMIVGFCKTVFFSLNVEGSDEFKVIKFRAAEIPQDE